MAENKALAPKGMIFDIDHFSVHDGPGIRTVVYFKGCPLRCVWCHSPESQSLHAQPLRIAARCQKCEQCAGQGCPHGAWTICGREAGVDEILAEIMQDKVFFQTSGGGVTLSGGEVLFQSEFALAILECLHAEGISAVVETSGWGKWEDLASLSPVTDYFYYDIKSLSPEKHLRFTGADHHIILENLQKLSQLRDGKGIVLRVPLIPGHNDSNDDVVSVYALASACNLDQVHLLPYNTSASAKYEWLARMYMPGDLKRQSAQRLDELRNLAPSQLNVTVQ